MAYWYFPKKDNLDPMTEDQLMHVRFGLAYLKVCELPWGYEKDVDAFRFYVDRGMTTALGIMGYTKFLSRRILLSPLTVQALSWKDANGIPNNEFAMATVVHELTHRRQMNWLGGLAWALFNIPLIDRFTIERWARANEDATAMGLSDVYDRLRNKQNER